MEKHKNIPELRFPEYNINWERKKIDSFIDFLSGYPFNGEDISEDPSGIPLMRGVNITEGRIRHSSDIDRFYDGDITKLAKYFLKEGDLVIGMDGSKVGKNSAIVDKENANSILVQRVARLREKENSSLPFIYHYINSIRFHKYVDEVKTSSGIPHISAAQIKDFKIALPTLPEQQKIASFLTAVDDKLTQLKQKKSLLEQYKKGVMQKIFSQEIRFKDEDGKEFPEWEKKRLGELYSFISTNSFSRENLNYENGEVKNIHYGDIHTKFKVQFDITKELVPYINSEIQLRISENNYCREGDLVIADASEDYADVGKSIEIVNLNHEKTVAGLHTILARPDLSILAVGFGGFLMKSLAVRNQIMIIAQGSKVLSISPGRLATIKIELPIKAQQTKIASFLSAIDEKINHCQLQIEKTVLYKKGLLQKMFC